MNLFMLMSAAMDIAVIAVFAPATVVTWRVHRGAARRLSAAAAGAVVVGVSASGFVIRVSHGGSVPMWFLAAYLAMFLAMAYQVWLNAALLQRRRGELSRLQRRQ